MITGFVAGSGDNFIIGSYLNVASFLRRVVLCCFLLFCVVLCCFVLCCVELCCWWTEVDEGNMNEIQEKNVRKMLRERRRREGTGNK